MSSSLKQHITSMGEIEIPCVAFINPTGMLSVGLLLNCLWAYGELALAVVQNIGLNFLLNPCQISLFFIQIYPF